MRVFVTGATGFLGRSLVSLLVSEGIACTASGRNKGLENLLTGTGAEFVSLDLSDVPGVMRALAGHDMVVHCAALSSPFGPYENFYQANVTNTESLLKAAKSNGLRRFVHISTPSVYFRFKTQSGILESDPLPEKKVNAYAQTKFLAEEKVREFAAKGMETIILRPRGLFGPHDTAIMPRVIRAGSMGFLPVFSKESILTDLTYVDNVSQAILAAIRADRQATGEIYNITNGEPVDLVPFLHRVFQAINKTLNIRYVPFWLGHSLAGASEAICGFLPGNKEPLMTRYLTGLFCFSQTLCIDKAKTCLGYRPRVSMDEGLDRFAHWWKNQDQTGAGR